MKCVIIDDEPLAIEVIEGYIKQIGGLDIVAKCTNPLDAFTILNKQQIDLVFLDIEMPNITGIDVVKTIENMPQFIFTTAYPQYAIDGFNLNATDYLVKPIPFHRFLKAISRAKEKHELMSVNEPGNFTSANPILAEAKAQDKFIFVKSEYENIKINIEDIMYIQGLKDYLKIYIQNSNKSILTLLSFKEILNKLPNNIFLRVHRSYIVNVSEIRVLQKTKLVVGDVRIPIGETYKTDVLKRLGV
ncbi:MAG: LytTR family DNA-binding domain-containing protein [Flavobacteriaceae bacterium]|nr:LytTR family DNA-binding domain-containing protein [Flavobacteriaceae bacterium]